MTHIAGQGFLVKPSEPFYINNLFTFIHFQAVAPECRSISQQLQARTDFL